MAHPQEIQFDVGHPAPDRGRVGRFTLLFALAGAPLAWSLEFSANAAISGTGCYAGFGPNKVSPESSIWVNSAVIGIDLAMFVMAFVSLGVSIWAYRKTGRHEHLGGGDLVDSGEGRTRFIAVWGIFTSILFSVAIAANTISVFWGGLCNP